MTVPVDQNTGSDSRNPLVSVIIVNWNRLQYLQQAVQSVLSGTYDALEIIIVDNGSQDGSIPWCQALVKSHPRTKLIQNATNEGFAKPSNQGAAVATGDILFLLNNDTIVEADCIEQMVSFLSLHPHIDVVQPRLMTQKQRMDEQGGLLLRNGFLLHLGFLGDFIDVFTGTYPVFTVKGAAFFVRRQVLSKTGLFRESFFAFYEETDFCHRVWRSGGRVFYHGEPVVYHIGHVTAGELKKNKSVDTWFLNYRNRLISMITVFDRRHLASILGVHILFNAFSMLFFALRRRHDLAKAICKSHFYVLRHFSDMLGERKRIRKHFAPISEHRIFSEYKLRVSAPKGYYLALFKGNLNAFWSTPSIQAWIRQVLSNRS